MRVILILTGALWYNYQRIGNGTGRLGNKKKSGDHQNYCIISQNTEKSPGNMRRLAVTHSYGRPSDDVGMKKSESNNNNQMTWKILTAQIREEIYYSLTSRGFFPEQKGCRKGSTVTGELLNIDQHILNEIKTKWKKSSYGLIDHKKTYVMVPQNWIINCLKIYKISNEVIKVIEKTMKT